MAWSWVIVARPGWERTFWEQMQSTSRAGDESVEVVEAAGWVACKTCAQLME